MVTSQWHLVYNYCFCTLGLNTRLPNIIRNNGKKTNAELTIGIWESMKDNVFIKGWVGVSEGPLKDEVALDSCGCNKLHKLSHLNQQKFILSQFWRPDVPNQYCWAKNKVAAGLCSLQRLSGRSWSMPISASGGCWHSLTHGHIIPMFKTNIF